MLGLVMRQILLFHYPHGFTKTLTLTCNPISLILRLIKTIINDGPNP